MSEVDWKLVSENLDMCNAAAWRAYKLLLRAVPVDDLKQRSAIYLATHPQSWHDVLAKFNTIEECRKVWVWRASKRLVKQCASELTFQAKETTVDSEIMASRGLGNV